MCSRLAEPDAGFIARLEKLVIEAGHTILTVKADGFEILEKKDQSPVTVADRSAEDVIVAGLEREFPGIPVVAEERCSDGIIPEISGGEFFLVDALDGTREFVSGRASYTVNIGFVQHGVPVAGVVYVPEQRRLFSAFGNTAMAVELGSNFQLLERSALHCRYFEKYQRIVASRSHRSSQTDDYINAHCDSKIVAVGSSLKFCLLAEGLADLYPRFSPTMEWDTAAGDAILRAAGGLTVTLDGKPLTYGKCGAQVERDFLNPHFLAKATNQTGMD